jgi:hypothetical protein
LGQIRPHLIEVSCGLYDKHIMIVNDDSSVVNKFGASLNNDARVAIYNRLMFIVQATGFALEFALSFDQVRLVKVRVDYVMLCYVILCFA